MKRENLLDYVVRELEVDVKNTLFNEGYLEKNTEISINRNAEDWVDNFLVYVGIENDEDLKQLKTEESDLWNDKNKNLNYFCDMASEWADKEVDIYYNDLYKKAGIFSYYVEEAIGEFGFDKERGFVGLLQSGQYLFYSQFANNVLTLAKQWLDEQDDEED